MTKVHSPNIIGPLALAGAPGTVGQVVTSAGAGVQAAWATPSGGSVGVAGCMAKHKGSLTGGCQAWGFA